MVTLVLVPTARLVESGFAERLNPTMEEGERLDAWALDAITGNAVRIAKEIPTMMNKTRRNV